MLWQSLIQFAKNWRTELVLGAMSASILLVGESSWHYLILVVGLVLMVLNHKLTDVWSFVRQPLIWSLLVVWLFAHGISTVFSIHVPASLQALAVPGMSVLWIWFWSGVRQQWLWRQRVVSVVSWVVSIFGLLQVIAWLWQPHFLEQFPRLNYLYNNFGHNHIAAIIIVLLPFVWLQIITPGRVKYRVPVWVGMWLVAMLGFAFSRLALAVGIAELVIIGYYLRHRTSREVQRNFISLIIFLVVFVIFKQVVTSSGFERLLCEQQLLTTEFCREQRHELRWWYWEQAWSVFQQSPIVGSGPGTFGYASRRFLQEHGANSAYAHNWILAALAETGVVGLVATVGLVVGTLMSVYLQQRTPWRAMSLLSLLCFWFLVLFDFDNQLFAVWSLVICCIGLSLRQPRPVGAAQQLSWGVKLRLGFQVSFTLVVLLYAGVQTYTQIEISRGVWPFVLRYLPVSVITPREITAQKLVVMMPTVTAWYQHDADVLFQVALLSDEHQKSQLLSQVARLDPWRSLLANQLAFTLQQDLPTTESWAEYYWDFYHLHWLRGTDISAEAKFTTSDGFYSLAERLFKHGEYEKSATWLVRAYQVEPWVLSRHKPFVSTEKAQSEMWRFTRPFMSFPRAAFGDYQAHYTRFFNEILMLAGQESMFALDLAVQQVLAVPSAQRAEQDLLYQQFIKQLGSELISISSLAYRVLPTEAERTPEMVDAVTDACLRVGDYSVGQKTKQVPQLYAVALRLKPWAMNGKKWWFERSDYGLPYRQDSLDFLDQWQTWEADWIGHNPESFVSLVNQGLIETVSDTSSARRKRYQYIYQQLTDQLRKNEK